MDRARLRSIWEQEEKIAHIRGWDFSHIRGRYESEHDLPWNYEKLVRAYLNHCMSILDYDTGGGEFLLSLKHPYEKTAATEGYPPNVKFDLILNRHGGFDAAETFRLLRPDGMFITEQVGGNNDRDLVEMVLPGADKPFPHLTLDEQRPVFESVGFKIVRAEEAYRPIKFYDVGAFVWFAHVIEWEFPDFSVSKCFERLLKMQEIIDRDGRLEGTIHRYLIAARK